MGHTINKKTDHSNKFKIMASFSIHFDGDITVDHKVSVRVLGKSYSCMQSAIDRAYLINFYGNVHKYARLTNHQYRETEFIAAYPREGGIWLDGLKNGANAIVDTINATISPLYERARQQGVDNAGELLGQIAERREYVQQVQQNVPDFNNWALDRRDNWADAFSNRSIAKEVDQLVSQVTVSHLQESVVQIQLDGSRVHPIYTFDRVIAKRFHKIVSSREIGPAVRLTVKVTLLDRGRDSRWPSAKAVNLENDKEFILQLYGGRPGEIGSADDVHRIHDGESYQIYAAPVMEANGFDVNRGDYLFLGLVNEQGD